MPLFPVPVPGQPHITEISATSTSISLSWSVPSDSVVASYEVMWQSLSRGGGITTETEDSDDDGSGTSGSTESDPMGMSGDEESGTSGSITDTSYTIENLTKCTSYIITVTVTNAADSIVSDPIRITTCKLKGKGVYYDIVTLVYIWLHSFNSER